MGRPWIDQASVMTTGIEAERERERERERADQKGL
jgi:hypothetical protein